MLALRVSAVLVFLWAGAAFAGSAYLTEARGRYERLDYRGALELLLVAKEVEGAAADELVEILKLMARCHIAEGAWREAERDFEELLAVAPSFEPEPDTAPKIRSLFEEVKARMYPKGYVALKHVPGPAGFIQIEVVDPYRRVAAVRIQRRVDALGRVLDEGVAVQPKITVARHVPQGPVSAWAAEAVASDGSILARAGEDLSAPSAALGTFPHREQPRLQRIPAWVLAGTALVLGATGIGLHVSAAQQASAAARSGSLADAQVAHREALQRATWASGFLTATGAATVASVAVFVW
jgi:hypothetical protein